MGPHSMQLYLENCHNSRLQFALNEFDFRSRLFMRNASKLKVIIVITDFIVY